MKKLTQARIKRYDSEAWEELQVEYDKRTEERKKRQQEEYERVRIPIELAETDEFLERVYGGRNAAGRSHR